MISWFSHGYVYTRQTLSSGLAPLLTEQNPKRYMKGGLFCVKCKNTIMNSQTNKRKINYPYGNRTHITEIKILRINHYTKGQ